MPSDAFYESGAHDFQESKVYARDLPIKCGYAGHNHVARTWRYTLGFLFEYYFANYDGVPGAINYREYSAPWPGATIPDHGGGTFTGKARMTAAADPANVFVGGNDAPSAASNSGGKWHLRIRVIPKVQFKDGVVIRVGHPGELIFSHNSIEVLVIRGQTGLLKDEWINEAGQVIPFPTGSYTSPTENLTINQKKTAYFENLVRGETQEKLLHIPAPNEYCHPSWLIIVRSGLESVPNAKANYDQGGDWGSVTPPDRFPLESTIEEIPALWNASATSNGFPGQEVEAPSPGWPANYMLLGWINLSAPVYNDNVEALALEIDIVREDYFLVFFIWNTTGQTQLADFIDPLSGSTFAPNPHVMQFTDVTVASNGKGAWLWDFGDGQTASIQNPQHTYTNIGTYNVTLTVTDLNGYSNSGTKQVTVLPYVSAFFTVSVTPFGASRNLHFTNLSGVLPPSLVATYLWDFGAPLFPPNTSTLRNPPDKLLVEGLGSVVVTLTVTAGGVSRIYQQTVSLA